MELQEHRDDYLGAGLNVFGVVGQSAASVRSFLEANPLFFPLLIDRDRSVMKAYGVYHPFGLDAFRIARPAAFLVDAQCLIVYRRVGRHQYDWPRHGELMAAISSHLPAYPESRREH